MRVVRIIELGLNIDDPISVYSSASANYMSMLTNQFKGVCIRGCRIEKILQIKKISECVIETRGEQCIGKVTVIVEVEATVATPGEVIVGCLVRHKDQGLIVASHPTSSIWLKSHEKFASIKPGQLISVVVGGSAHSISSNSISINAIPFLPRHDVVGYRIEGTLTVEDRTAIAASIDRLNAEEQKLEQLNSENPKAVDFFNKLIYPYRADMPAPGGAQRMNVRDLLNTDVALSGWFVRDKRIKPIEPILHRYDLNSMPDDEHIAWENPESIQYAIAALIDDLAQNMRIVREFSETYNTNKLMTDHANLWKIFHSVKK